VNEISNLIRSLRGNKSLRDAAKKIGISHSYLSVLENGIDPRTKTPVNPSPDTLKRISEAYDYSYESLMKAAGYLNSRESVIQDQESVRGIFIEADLSPESVQELRKFAELLKIKDMSDRNKNNNERQYVSRNEN